MAASDSGATTAGGGAGKTGSTETWPLWEVFIRSSRGLAHVHAGSLHAPDAVMAVRNARDLYTRRGEGVSVWVVPSSKWSNGRSRPLFSALARTSATYSGRCRSVSVMLSPGGSLCAPPG